MSSNVENCLNALDTYIDVMKEESAKLSGMIEKLNEKIKEIEVKKEQLIKEQNESKFELTQNEKYYFIDFLARGSGLAVQEDIYENVCGDKVRVSQNNCFKTEKRAKEVLDKIELLLKLERLHDIYCPNYKPNWNKDAFSLKHSVRYNTSEAKWYPYDVRIIKDAAQVYFPTDEIAQKVCDRLNREEQSNEIS